MEPQPTVGDEVMFEGLAHRIMDMAHGRVRFASEMMHGAKPRFETIAAVADLRWSEDLQCWYLWGRLLGKGRGDVGIDQRAVVSELRDRGLLPARATRRPGQAPAGGEHENLCCALFCKGIDWSRELERLRRGAALTEAAQAAVADYASRFQRKLVSGYADPGADDSWGEE